MFQSLQGTLNTTLKDVVDAVDHAPQRDAFRSDTNTFFGLPRKQVVGTPDVLRLVTTDLLNAKMDQIDLMKTRDFVLREGIKGLKEARLTLPLILWYGQLVARESRKSIRALSKVAVLPPEFKAEFGPTHSLKAAEKFFQTGELMTSDLFRAVFIFSSKNSSVCLISAVLTASATASTKGTSPPSSDNENEKKQKLQNYTVEITYHDTQSIFEGENTSEVITFLNERAKEVGAELTYKERTGRVQVTSFTDLYYLWALRASALPEALAPPLTDANALAYAEHFLREIVADMILPYRGSGAAEMSPEDLLPLFIRERSAASSATAKSAAEMSQSTSDMLRTEDGARRFLAEKPPNTLLYMKTSHYPPQHVLNLTYADTASLLHGNVPNKNVVELYLHLLMERSVGTGSGSGLTPRGAGRWRKTFVFSHDRALRPSLKNAKDIGFDSFEVLLFPVLPDDSSAKTSAPSPWRFVAVCCSNSKDSGNAATAHVLWFDPTSSDGYDKRYVTDAIETYKKVYPGARKQNIDIRRVEIRDRGYDPISVNVVFLLYVRTLIVGEPLIDFRFLENVRLRFVREVVTQRLEETSFRKALDLVADMSVCCCNTRKEKVKEEPLSFAPTASGDGIQMSAFDDMMDDFMSTPRTTKKSSPSQQQSSTPNKAEQERERKKMQQQQQQQRHHHHGPFDSIYNGTWDEIASRKHGNHHDNDNDNNDDSCNLVTYERLVQEKMERLRKLIEAHEDSPVHVIQGRCVTYTDLRSLLPGTVPSAAAVAWYIHMVQDRWNKKQLQMEQSKQKKSFVVNSTLYDSWLVEGTNSLIRAAAAAPTAAPVTIAVDTPLTDILSKECDKVLFPICVDACHWCLFITQGSMIDRRRHTVQLLFFDPLGEWSDEVSGSVTSFCEQLFRVVYKDQYTVSVVKLPNSNTEPPSPLDSGVIILYFIKTFFNGVKAEMDKVDCDLLRLEIATEIFLNSINTDMSSATRPY